MVLTFLDSVYALATYVRELGVERDARIKKGMRGYAPAAQLDQFMPPVPLVEKVRVEPRQL